MIVKAWNNGTHNPDGNGYGIKLDPKDRDELFEKSWKSIQIVLEGESESIEVNIDKPSFWNETCCELISVEIGRWLIKNHPAPWEKRNPPKLELTRIIRNQFRLRK